jgi:hypothetical protein
MEQLQPDPLVDKTSEELNKLHKGLRYYADKLDNLFCPTWANPCLILNKLGELDKLIDEHDLLGAWFSAHAKKTRKNYRRHYLKKKVPKCSFAYLRICF